MTCRHCNRPEAEHHEYEPVVVGEVYEAISDNDTRPCCSAFQPPPGAPFACTRPAGHDGPHQAHGHANRVYATCDAPAGGDNEGG